ncbi:Orange carotenoid protein [Nodosilinea sp. LEGE 07088]|uniref:orange carotenoid protein N-terminal domain-containing protein n=1 Tax=Nodosilinea sp. LEGE 07088 TaxID=2777968 RepID=UPI00187E7715|nr:orange carotenoid protein N-terminal domain-containing protein [Nodosilinea sp. LEGE 07088]MBE9139582.1 Orange carotenoid protein [Nodosilinea sp. LEGE 07088]
MTYTLNAPAVSSVGLATPVSSAISAFKGLATDEQLGLLWVLYENMGRAITPAAPGAARLQFAEGLLAQVRDMTPSEQLQFMRDLVERNSTPATRAYGVLTNNTKLAFWYQLAEAMQAGTVIPVPSYYKLGAAGIAIFGQISKLDFNQQITVLRQVVVAMGVDPLA